MGSLDTPGSKKIGPVVHDLMVDLALKRNGDHDTQHHVHFPGPFTNLRDYYHALIPRILHMIVVGELSHSGLLMPSSFINSFSIY